MEERLLPVSIHESTSRRDKMKLDSDITTLGECLSKQIRDLAPLRPQACICRVHSGLRNVNEEAYTPMLISIGPYHYGHPKLAAMQDHKLRYLSSFLQRTGKTLESCLQRLDSLHEEAKLCYEADSPINTMGRRVAVKMMLLDACFIIEFLLRSEGPVCPDEDDPIFKASGWMQSQICRDLLLLENQIPFFLLFNLMDKQEDDRVSLLELAKSMLADMLNLPDSPPPPHRFVEWTKNVIHNIFFKCCYDHEKIAPTDHDEAKDPKHFLDLLSKICVPTTSIKSMDHDEDGHPCLKKILNCLGKDTSSDSTSTSMACVSELQDAGITFEVNKRQGVKLFDIEFQGGHLLWSARLKIPVLTTEDDTETVFRNMIAYEQHFVGEGNRYFSNYATFLDDLINSEEDARHLRFRGIISNQLGDDKEVATLICKLGQGLIMDSPDSYHYTVVCRGVNAHCQKQWNQVMAIIRRNYLNNPWAVVTTCFALLILALTTTATVLSLINAFA